MERLPSATGRDAAAAAEVLAAADEGKFVVVDKNIDLPDVSTSDDDEAADLRMKNKVAALPPWYKQLSVRGLITGAALGLLFCIITMKLNLGPAGIVPSLNVPGGLLAFAALKLWVVAGSRIPGLGKFSVFHGFGIQENNVVQTLINACYNIAFTGGYGMYLLAMSYQAYLNLGGAPEGTPGYDPSIIYNPDLSRIYPYLLLISVIGVFMLTILRKTMIVDWKLPFPSGTATGIMLESFHTTFGEKEALRKTKMLGITSLASFLFDLFKWFFQGADYSCGLTTWPTFGFAAYNYTWQFDWNQNYIGSGMICPHIVNWSMLLGAIISWGIMWPVFTGKEGEWYPAGLGSHNFKGLFGYKVFLTIALLMGEGIYMLLRVFYLAALDWYAMYKAIKAGKKGVPVEATDKEMNHTKSLIRFKETEGERKLRTAVFLSETIPWWVAVSGYLVFAALGIGCIPLIYPPVKREYLVVAYILAPILAVPNVYGCGLTDWDNSSMYGKLALFIISSWAGTSNNGIIAGLGICGVVLSATSSAATLMQDFRTGYICLSAPRAMFTAQITGALLGCLLSPVAFQMFNATGQIGDPNGPYPNPFADIYRGMAIIGTEGFSSLPKYCGALVGAFFGAAMLICLIRDLLPAKYGRFVPSPMAMGIPFYIGANNAIDFWIGSLIVHIWEYVNKKSADQYAVIIGAGLLVGDGVWAIPSSLMTVFGYNPPICMTFYPGDPPASS